MKLVVCSKCGESKPSSEFFKDRQKTSGLRPDCKTCNMVKSRAWAEANKHRRKAYSIKSIYGITIDEYNALLAQQNYRCAICDVHQDSMNKALHVDHCHRTGKVRGLLCVNCNSALGKLKDSVAVVLRAAKYLENNQ